MPGAGDFFTGKLGEASKIGSYYSSKRMALLILQKH